MVGRYAIHGKIASGGMATVHLGRLVGEAGFARTVAVKRLHAHLAQDEEFVLMFIDEARIAARIRHPNVVQTLDVVSSDEELLLVMDYVPGESLSRLMHATSAQGRGAPPKIAAAVMSGVLHGLHAAHQARDEHGIPLEIVHRDVSPQNVLVGTDGVPRVLDFGVAAAVGRVQSTRAGSLKGKMSYMAPERVRGDPADRRSDIYASSVVLWEMLTGKRLFRGDDEAQTLAQVMKGWHEPPSGHAPDLPPAFDAVVMRGLAMDPLQRFATAADMARALEGCVGLATPSEVGDWVQAMAGEQLEQRAYAISRIESQSGSMPSVTPEMLAQSDLRTAVSDVHSSPSTSGPISSRLRVAALAASPAMRAALGVTMPAGPAMIVAGIAVAVGIVVATLLALRLGSTPAAPSPSASAALEVPSSPPAEPSAGTPPTMNIDDLPTAAAQSATPQPPARLNPFVPPPAPPPARPRASCDPPYYYDADGVKHYKRECN